MAANYARDFAGIDKLDSRRRSLGKHPFSTVLESLRQAGYQGWIFPGEVRGNMVRKLLS